MGPCEEELLAKFSIDLDTHLWQLVEVYQPRLYLFALRLEHHRRHHGPGPDSEHTLCTTCVGETSMVVAAFHDIDLFKIAGRLILLLSCIFLLAACGDSDISQPAQAPVTPTPTTPENRAQQANDVVQGANLAGTNVRVSLSGSVLTISEDLSPYGIGGNGLVIDNIKQGCYDVQKAVWTSSLSKHLSQVKLNITVDTQDQF